MRWYGAIVLAAVGLQTLAPAKAGVLGDDLTRCFLKKATEADRTAFMGWMFSAISADSELNKLTTLDRVKRDSLSENAGATMQRLLISDCRQEAIAAIKSEGMGVIEQPFEELGRQATEQMFRSPVAQVELEALDKGFDANALQALAREAGISEGDIALPAKK